ncbi:MAG: hypothetical protein PHP11_06280 [Erysipelotrichaceae bacterium]|nr:hypothetical protein [Erysipelotrichaceae bacterium]
MGVKQQFKSLILKNEFTKKVYDVYHEHAKYLYQVGKPRFLVLDQIGLIVFDQHKQTFFGYYDKSPERNGHYLYHALDNNSLRIDQTVDIYIDDQKIGSSHSWNWQQGAMLSWLEDDKIIYNDFIEGQYRSIIKNLKGDLIRIIDFPIYQVSKDGKFALSVNFSRLAKLRSDYGYFNLPYDNVSKIDDKDGVFYIDIVNNERKLLIDLVTIANTKHHESMIDAYHEVNHVDISNDQSKAIFLHRWYKDKERHSRLMLVDINLATVRVLVDEGMVSHCTWKNDQEIVGYFKYQDQNGYFLIDINTNIINRIDGLVNLIDDGHPSFSKDRSYMITDTYPDHTCRSKLILWDQNQNETTVIGSFYVPRKYKDTKRCDLHPRWSSSKYEVTFDTVFDNKRQMCKINIDNFLRSDDDGKS